MPEGLTSIEDLKVVITAETEKLAAGLGNANALIQRFTGDGEKSLGRFDGAVAKIGASVLSMSNALTAWAAAANTALGVLEKVVEKGDAAMKLVGVEGEWNELKDAVYGIVSAFQEFSTQTDASTRATSKYKEQIAQLQNLDWEQWLWSGVGANDALQKAMLKTIEMADRAAHEARRLTTNQQTWKPETVDAEIARTTRAIEDLEKRIASYKTRTAGQTVVDLIVGSLVLGQGNRLSSVVDDLDSLNKRLADYKALLPQLEALRVTQQWKQIDVVESSAFVRGIDAEVEALKLKAATLNMATAEAAAYVAMEKMKIELAKGDKSIDVDHVKQQIQLMRQLRQQIEDHAEAKRKAQQAEREAERQQKGADSLMHGAERELAALRAKQAALGGVTAATKAAEVEERLLEQARARNIVVTEKMALEIKAAADAIGRADEQLRQHQKTLDTVNQAMAPVFRTAETAFDKFTSGSKFKMRDMVESMLRDIEKLMFRLLILKPLQEATGQAMTGGLSGMLGGFRAEGGPVSRGVPYIVGERGPELMVPESYGSIIPNHALKGAASAAAGPVNVQVNITAPAGTGARETGRRSDGSNMTLDILVEQLEGSMAQRVGDGTSALGASIENRFGLSSAAGAR